MVIILDTGCGGVDAVCRLYMQVYVSGIPGEIKHSAPLPMQPKSIIVAIFPQENQVPPSNKAYKCVQFVTNGDIPLIKKRLDCQVV